VLACFCLMLPYFALYRRRREPHGALSSAS
jgi:hypothetical protein